MQNKEKKKMLQMLGEWIGVEKTTKGQSTNILAMPEDSETSGKVVFVGDEVYQDINVGDRVFFGNARQQLTLPGRTVLVMKYENIMLVEKQESAVEAEEKKEKVS